MLSTANSKSSKIPQKAAFEAKGRQYIYTKGKVIQHLQGVSKVRPIVNCILRKAFNASLGKCKLIQVGNLSK